MNYDSNDNASAVPAGPCQHSHSLHAIKPMSECTSQQDYDEKYRVITNYNHDTDDGDDDDDNEDDDDDDDDDNDNGNECGVNHASMPVPTHLCLHTSASTPVPAQSRQRKCRSDVARSWPDAHRRTPPENV